jgi:hypothetical protein
MKTRKTRSDKGVVLATVRDLHVMEWIGHQYVARLDQVQGLLSREPGAPMRGTELALPTVRDQVDRWRRAGWAEYYRFLADEPGWVWLSRQGLRMVNQDEVYTARQPAATRLHHLYAVNQVRLGLEAKKHVWTSERWLKSQLKKGESKPIPDGVIATPSGKKIAIEVELSLKKPEELWGKVVRLVRHTELDRMSMRYRGYDAIWFYVPSEQLRGAILDAAAGLKDEDEQKKISVAVTKL